MRLSPPSFMLGIGVALMASMVLSLDGGGFSLININVGVSDVPDMESEDVWTPRMGWDAMFTGGATLLGLVVFGAALSVLLTRNTEEPYGLRTIEILRYGVILAAMSSWGSCFLRVVGKV